MRKRQGRLTHAGRQSPARDCAAVRAGRFARRCEQGSTARAGKGLSPRVLRPRPKEEGRPGTKALNPTPSGKRLVAGAGSSVIRETWLAAGG
jgi:hypothetical protein